MSKNILLYARKVVSYIKYHILYYVKLYRKDPHTIQFHRWTRRRGDETLRLDYPLDSNSIVFDLGGYKGQWAKSIYDKYKCRVHIFEPVGKHYKDITGLFKDNPLVSVYNFGLLDENATMEICLDNDGSSLYGNSSDKERVAVKDVNDFVHDAGVLKIDLMKINIEGSEYRLLNRMIACNVIQRIVDLQVQFHRCIESHEEERLCIRSKLAATHYLTYDFPFLWENWKRKVVDGLLTI